MTDKQRILLNSLLDRLDMNNKHHRINLVRKLANSEYRYIDEIPTDLMSFIINSVYQLLAEPQKAKEKNNEK